MLNFENKRLPRSNESKDGFLALSYTLVNRFHKEKVTLLLSSWLQATVQKVSFTEIIDKYERFIIPFDLQYVIAFCGRSQQIKDKIVGGTIATAGEFPW